MRSVPEKLLPLVPLFCECLTQMGTEKESFVELTERIGRKVGSLSVYPFVSSQEGSKEPVAKIFVQGKATADKSGDLAELMRDILTTTVLDDRERFKQLVLETKAGLEAGIVSSGNRFAGMRLAAQQTTAGYVNELMNGYSYLQYTRKLVDRVESDWEGVLQDLQELRRLLVSKSGAIINMTGDERTLTSSKPHVVSLLDSLPAVEAPFETWSSLLPAGNEVLTVPTQVNYVGKSVNLFEHANYDYHGSAMVVVKNINAAWLWEKVRALGGAYGCGASLDSVTGLLTFTSFRDPNVLSTLEYYDTTAGYLRDVQLDKDALTKAIIGAISTLDRYQLPDAKGMTALTRKLIGITDEERQLRRDQVLATTSKDFNMLADYLECVKSENAKIAAVTSPDVAQKILQENPGFWDVKSVI